MTTWKCHDCESQFFEPETLVPKWFGNWEEEEYNSVCPVCGSDEIYEATICCDCEKEVGEGELDEDDLCPECAARADAYDEMVDRVKEALSTPFDMAQMVKQILTKPKGE